MKYKKLRLTVDISVEGIPNKKKEYVSLYKAHFFPTFKTMRRLLDYLEEWFPVNKKVSSSLSEE